MSPRKIVVLEFNELCPSLLGRWMGEGKLPNFKRFHDASQVMTGLADVTEQQFLEPWIQWYSLHTGLDYYTHQVFNLTDGPSAGHTDIWHALLDGGLTVGNFGGMNAGRFDAPGSFYVPDPWCTTEPPSPATLADFHGFIASKVQDSTRTAPAHANASATRFLSFLVRHGLSLESVLAVGRQLASETRQPTAWKRASLLDQLQTDVFLHTWCRTRPDFASIFMNSTAHFQHAYFHLIDDPQADPLHHEAVFFGYRSMDRFLARLVPTIEARGGMPVLVSALSQQMNPDGGSKYYRPRDCAGLLARIDVAPRALLPVMAHQFSAQFGSVEEAAEARRRIEGITLDGRPIFQFGESPSGSLYFDNGIRRTVPQGAVVTITSGNSVVEEDYHAIFHLIPHTKSGIHHPESVMWFKTGSHRVHAEKVSILDMFPTLLDYYGVPMAPRDGLERRGRSLVDRLSLGAYRAPVASAAAE
jgi:hypothetical protein